MKTKFLQSFSGRLATATDSGLSTPPFARRLTNAAAARARFPSPPVGSLIDPHLLDRLQVPLTRYRD